MSDLKSEKKKAKSTVRASSGPSKVWKKAALRQERKAAGSSKELKLTKQIASAHRDKLMEAINMVVSKHLKVESKEHIAPFRGSASPMELRDNHSGFVYQPTEESKSLMNLMGSVWGEGEHRFNLTTALNMSSSGTGTVNSVVAVNAIQFLSSFAALAVVFSEYFIDSMTVHWEPVSLANGPVTFTNSTQVATLPLGVASLQHDAPAYTNLSNMTNHSSFSYHNTGRAFSHRWVNVESSKSGAMYGTESGTTAGYQGWQLVTRSTNYSGQIQYISQSAPPALPATQVLGTFVVNWHVRFRIRQ